MAESDTSREILLKQAVQVFQDTFGYVPSVAGYAPGRVNLIGEHTDYNEGFVLPMALNLAAVMVGSDNNSNLCQVKTAYSQEKNSFTEFLTPSSIEIQPGTPHWANYIKGVVTNFKGEVKGFHAAVASSVPIGGGLSSSAALEVATYTFLEALFPTNTDPTEKALACQKAEHTFANTPCGIMDQFISILAQKGNALLIDCMDLTCKLIPMNITGHMILITNSNVKHSLMTGEYATRRKQCEMAAELLGATSLRHVSLDSLFANRMKMPELIFNRAHHVISEINRTTKAAQALSTGDLVQFGQLMNESHDSLRDDFEVSCAELDILVTAARELPEVRGSRMTGGGFGGCTVTLVQQDAVMKLKSHLEAKYSGTLTFYTALPSQGAEILDLGVYLDTA